MATRAYVSRATVLGAGASALLAGFVPKRSSGTEPTPLRIGAAPTDATGELFYGVDNGFYKDAGLDVRINIMRNGGDLTAALAGGSLDVIVGTIVPIAEAYGHGISDFRIIAPGSLFIKGQRAAIVVAVAATSPTKNAAALNGKTIGVNGLRDLTNLALVSWVDSNGGDLGSIKLVELPFSEMGAALEQGRIAAALIGEPFTSALVSSGKITVIGDALGGIGQRFLGTVFISKLSWLSEQRDAAKRFAASTLKIGSWANTHRDATADILALRTGMSAATINSVVRAEYATTPTTPALLQPVLDAAAKYFGAAKLSGSTLIWNG